MIRLRSFVTLALASIALASCSTTYSADGNKGTLTEKGYTASIKTAAEYTATEDVAKTLPAEFGMTHYLSAHKSDTKDHLFAWYFPSIDDAGKWSEKYRNYVLDIKTEDESELGFGTANNVVYIATLSAAQILGWRA